MFRASVICHHIIAWPTWPCDDVVRWEAELWVTLRVESGWEWNCLNGWVVTVQSGSVGHQHISTILPLPVYENYADSESVIRWSVQSESYKRVLRDVSQIWLVCFIIEIIGTMMNRVFLKTTFLDYNHRFWIYGATRWVEPTKKFQRYRPINDPLPATWSFQW